MLIFSDISINDINGKRVAVFTRRNNYYVILGCVNGYYRVQKSPVRCRGLKTFWNHAGLKFEAEIIEKKILKIWRKQLLRHFGPCEHNVPLKKHLFLHLKHTWSKDPRRRIN